MVRRPALSKPWPSQLTLGDKLQRLGLLAPHKLRAIEALVDHALIESWPSRVNVRTTTMVKGYLILFPVLVAASSP